MTFFLPHLMALTRPVFVQRPRTRVCAASASIDLIHFGHVDDVAIPYSFKKIRAFVSTRRERK